MAQLFHITVPQGMSSVKLDRQGRANVQFTAKNVSATSIDGKGVLASFPRTSPASGAVENGWVKIDGPQERHFDKDREETFAVKIAVPAKSKPGAYNFRLNVVSVARPDEGDASPTVAFEVAAAAVATGDGRKWMPIILVIVLVLAVGGVATWLIVRKPRGTLTQTVPAQTEPGTQSSGQPARSRLKLPQPNPLPFGPDTCKPGFVWRDAVPNEHVCVPPAVRAQTAQDNALAGSRRNPGGGPYGPDTCIPGYVWRGVVPQDHVCVTPQTRAQIAADNAQAASRKVQP